MINDTCLFCRIVSGELDGPQLASTDDAIAFLDLHPRSPGHTVVIPKFHAASLSDLPVEKVGPLFELVRSTATMLGEKFGTDGMTIGINQGVAGQQSVPHLHVHLIPRYIEDGGASIHEVVHIQPTPAQQEIINSLIP